MWSALPVGSKDNKSFRRIREEQTNEVKKRRQKGRLKLKKSWRCGITAACTEKLVSEEWSVVTRLVAK